MVTELKIHIELIKYRRNNYNDNVQKKFHLDQVPASITPPASPITMPYIYKINSSNNTSENNKIKRKHSHKLKTYPPDPKRLAYISNGTLKSNQ